MLNKIFKTRQEKREEIDNTRRRVDELIEKYSK